MAQPTLLLKGSFDSFTIDDVLDVVGMSRQTMRVVLDDSGRGGEFLVKAGRVIHAAAPPVEGRRAFVNIYREPGQGFAVWQHVEAVGEPIGMLADLIQEAKALEKEPTVPSRMPMLAGSFNDHRLDEVLDVLNMTRQLVEFKVIREDESRVTMILKAGQVLACEDERASTSGLSAFRTLFADPGTHFEVVRLNSTPDDLPPPIGRLPALVQQALKEDAQAGKKRAGVLFQGAFKNFPLSDVLEALSVTRLTVEMVFHDSDGTRGTFVLKAGQVLAAQALRTGASHRQAFLELMAEPGESFVVVRRPGVPAGEPIGQLRELLAEARTRKGTVVPSVSPSAPTTLRAAPPPSAQPTESLPKPAPPPVTMTGKGRGPVSRAHTPVKSVPPPAPAVAAPSKPVVPKANPVPSIAAAKAAASTAKSATPPGIEIVLDGMFDSFKIDDVLEVMGISRQYVALGTLRNGVPLARLVVKSGRLLMASYGSVKDPVEAMAMLLEDPGTEFRVRRLQRYADSDLGSLAEIVERARKSRPPAAVLHLPQARTPAPPVAAPAPAPAPEVDNIDLDDLFEDDSPPPPPVAAPKPEPAVEVWAKERAKAKTQAKLQQEAQDVFAPVPEAKPAAPAAKADAPRPERVPVPTPAPKAPASKVEPKVAPAPKAEPKVAAKADAPKPERVAVPTPAPKAEPKVAAKVDAPKAEPKVAAKAEPKVAPKVEPKPELEDDLFADLDDEPVAKPEPKVAAKAEPQPVVVEPEPEPEPVVAEPEPEPVVAEPEPQVAATKTEPEPEPKVAARPVAAEAPPVAAVAADATQVETLARTLALLEERLRTVPAAPPAPVTTAAVPGEDVVAALKGITSHLEAVSKTVEAMGTRMEAVSKETRIASRQTKMTWIFVFLLAGVVLAVAAALFLRP